jgi:hypothetical protein
MAALILAGLMILSALHAAAPHHRGPGPCVACQTLIAPAVVPLAEGPAHPPEPQRLAAASHSDDLPDTSAPRLRPLRAPPRLSPA